MRPSRYLAVLAVIFIALYSAVLIGGPDKMGDKLKPKLGLDLVGGTTLTLIATNQGRAPSGDALERARQIIANRVDGLGVQEAQVVTEGDRNIVISIAGEANDTIRQVGTPAELRFRKVINSTASTPDTSTDTTPSPSPSASATASPAATPTPAATTPAATTPAATPSAAPSASPGATTGPKLEDVLKKLGPAAGVAAGLQGPADPSDPSITAALEPFTKLTADEVAILDPAWQFNVPQVTCGKLNGRTPGSIVAKDKQVVACDDQGTEKFMLDISKVAGTDVAKADAGIESATSPRWVVNLSFTGDGQKRWTALTKEAYDNAGSACIKLGPDSHCQVAVVLDNEVVSAPEVQEVQPGGSTISGSFTKTSAQLLASQLRYGALPLTFNQGEANSITATLGTQQLQAGLLAAGIGMLLVIVYAFFYYRLLGSVIFLSLALSGLLTFGMLILLGRSIGFTLTLAGIAGFIVSLGVAADSFVIYFERLKDEIREGRSPRSAIPRAWARARRTIITANAVTFLAALFLYLVGVGSVRGFAFALGLSTLLDLVIVFLFRHPIMTLLARTPAFLSPRVSGLGRVLQHAAPDTPATGTKRVKEA
jgi:preprotein translocase subunit SecD